MYCIKGGGVTMRKGRLRALIWDVDGTLADTERYGHRVAFNRAFADRGWPVQWDETTYGRWLRVAGGKERLQAFLSDLAKAGVVDLPRDDATIAALHQEKTRHYLEILGEPGAIPLRPGVLRLIQEARQAGWLLAVATTTTFENVEALLTQAVGPEAITWFQCIGAGDVVTAKKPAPDIYHWVLQRLQCQPGECLAIEDSALGLQAAQAAGLPTLVTVNDYTRDDAFPQALAVLENLGEPHHPAPLLWGPEPGPVVVTPDLLARWHHDWLQELSER